MRQNPSSADPADLTSWRQAQAGLAVPLAETAGAFGRLDVTLAALPAAAGARARLALAETEAMLWAGGMVLPREEISRDALDARAAGDPEAMRLARWALRRQAGLSPPDRVIEPAVHAARLMAQGCERLSFAPFGPAGRRV